MDNGRLVLHCISMRGHRNEGVYQIIAIGPSQLERTSIERMQRNQSYPYDELLKLHLEEAKCNRLLAELLRISVSNSESHAGIHNISAVLLDWDRLPTENLITLDCHLNDRSSLQKMMSELVQMVARIFGIRLKQIDYFVYPIPAN